MKERGVLANTAKLIAAIAAAALLSCSHRAGTYDHTFKGMAFSPGPTTTRLDWLISAIGKAGVPPVSRGDLRKIKDIERVAPPGRRRYLRFAFIEPEHTLVVYDGVGNDPQALWGNGSFRDLVQGMCGNIYYFPMDNTETSIPDPDPCWGWTRQKATTKP